MKRNSLTPFIFFSLIIHLVFGSLVFILWPHLSTQQKPHSPMTVVIKNEPKKETVLEEVTPPVNDIGQIVDLPDPIVDEKPEEAEYLAEHSRVVEKETKTDEFRINPEVLAEEYSIDDALQFEDVMDLNATDPSTGATAGNDRFRPEEDGVLAALPSPYTMTNKEGLQRPVPSSSTSSNRAGAPNNDLLNEELGSAVQLNTHEYQFASYMNQIRRLVNFYWNQQLQNLNSPLSKPKYRTVVDVVLDNKGRLSSISIKQSSGISALDDCVITAFHIAGPYPEPPLQLISEDSLVHLPSFGFEVEVGSGRSHYDGVDPRAGVRYPGILKAAR